MSNFKLNESDILSNQDWTFPTNIAYGPGRLTFSHLLLSVHYRERTQIHITIRFISIAVIILYLHISRCWA